LLMMGIVILKVRQVAFITYQVVPIMIEQRMLLNGSVQQVKLKVLDTVLQNVKSIFDTYTITQTTYALIPTRSINHQTKVIEENNIYYINQSPFEIIQYNCLLNGSDYSGRRAAVRHHLGFIRKSPIAISKSLHAFPTHATTNFDCIWIFSNHVSEIMTQHEHSKIIFRNNYTLTLPISK